MQIRKATIEDIGLLVELRLDYIRADWGSLPEEQKAAIRAQFRPYLMAHLPAGDFVAMLAMEGETVMAAAYLVISEKPANPTYPNGLTGLILNVLTYPPYRRWGIATRLLESLIEQARERNVSCLELSATEEGRPLYERLGFSVSRCPAMRMNLPGGGSAS